MSSCVGDGTGVPSTRVGVYGDGHEPGDGKPGVHEGATPRAGSETSISGLVRLSAERDTHAGPAEPTVS